MSFGNGKSQSNPADCQWEESNNFCGGFALNAILTDLRVTNKTPMYTYWEIQGKQHELFLKQDKPNYTTEFMLDSNHGTLMSLPSAMCHIISSYIKQVPLAICRTELFGNSYLYRLWAEETAKLSPLDVSINNIYSNVREMFEMIAMYKYFLVLVNDSHWIAVKKETENLYSCYDPENGKNSDAKSALAAINAAGYKENQSSKFISGLVIVVLLE